MLSFLYLLNFLISACLFVDLVTCAVYMDVGLVVDDQLSLGEKIIEVAKRDIENSEPPISPNFSIILHSSSSSSCSQPNMMSSLATLAQYYYKNNISAIFGPTCYSDLEIAARMTSEWNILQFNFWADSFSYITTNVVQMTTRSTINVAENILAVLNGSKWKKIAIVSCNDCYHLEESSAKMRSKNVTQYLEQNGIEILGNLDIQSTWNYTQISEVINKLAPIARVIIPFLGNSLFNYTKFMQAMNTSGFSKDEYSVIIVLSDYQMRRIELPWEIDSNLLQYFNKTIVIYNNNFDLTRVNRFLEMNGIVPTSLDALLYIQLYESVFVYVNQLGKNETISNIDFPNGPFGPIFFNNNTQRIAPFSLAYINDSGLIQIAKIDIDKSCPTAMCLFVNMSRTLLDLNQDMPTCGFKGELCDQTGTVIIIAAVMTAVFVSVGIFVAVRRMKSGETAAMPWSITHANVKIIDLDAHCHTQGSQHQSILSLNEHMESKVKMRDFLRMRQLATIDQTYVVMEKFVLKERIVFDKHDLNLLFQMKQCMHDNVNSFIGLSFDKAPHFLVLWTHCFRGSLAEQIFSKKEDSRIDHNFRGAFVRDILKGLDYIHQCSGVGYHGALTPGQCLIDSHWILKISGFGISRMLYRWKNNCVIATEDGRPLIPNGELHYYSPEMRAQLKSLMYTNRADTITLSNASGQASDMWSFGTILYEMVFRRKHVDVEDVYEGEEENVIMCEKAEAQLIREPVVPEDGDVHADILNLIQKCWKKENQRPDAVLARKITDSTLKMSGSLVDQMIKNMEQYTTGLEELVKERTGQLEEEQKKSDELLSELLPKSIAEELKVGRRVDARNYKSATILYSDIVGFTSLCSESEPMEVVALLSGMFQKFDHIISLHHGYKMETIGDAYCVASGIPSPSKTEHVRNIATIALLQREFLYDFMIPHRPGQYLHCRWGFNTGAVFTGVVGIRAPRYSVFGPTVTIAAKMESTGIPDKIQMTLKSHQMLSARFPEFKCSTRGSVKIDGIGTLLTYWLDGVEDLLRSDRSIFDKAMHALEKETDLYSYQGHSSQISSATSVVPLIK